MLALLSFVSLRASLRPLLFMIAQDRWLGSGVRVKNHNAERMTKVSIFGLRSLMEGSSTLLFNETVMRLTPGLLALKGNLQGLNSQVIESIK